MAWCLGFMVWGLRFRVLRCRTWFMVGYLKVHGFL